MQKTHIEIRSLEGTSFLFRKDLIVSASEVPCPEWVKEKYFFQGDYITIINVDERDPDGKLQNMMVKNTYSSLKKSLA